MFGPRREQHLRVFVKKARAVHPRFLPLRAEVHHDIVAAGLRVEPPVLRETFRGCAVVPAGDQQRWSPISPGGEAPVQAVSRMTQYQATVAQEEAGDRGTMSVGPPG